MILLLMFEVMQSLCSFLLISVQFPLFIRFWWNHSASLFKIHHGAGSLRNSIKKVDDSFIWDSMTRLNGESRWLRWDAERCRMSLTTQVRSCISNTEKLAEYEVSAH